ncbi:hypothetical protein Tco_1064961, partial [Tanacetum coccineum]
LTTNNNNNTGANRGPNPNLLCKNYGLIGHTVERCYELIGYHAGFKRNPNLSRQSRNNNKRFNANCEVNQSVPSTSGSLSPSFTNEQMSKSDMYKVTLGWIIDSSANKHMTNSVKDMFNVVDISSLMVTVGHPNGTLVKISDVGSLRLSSGIVLFDVLVVPEYNDLNQGKIVGTGNESGGLYLFDMNTIGRYIVFVPALHKKQQRIKELYAVSRRSLYAVFHFKYLNILEDIKGGPYSKKPLIRRIDLNQCGVLMIFQRL